MRVQPSGMRTGIAGFGDGLVLRHVRCVRNHAGHRQPMPVLHGGVAIIAKLGLPSARLAIKPAVRVAGTRMGVVLSLLAMEVRAVIIVAAAVLGTKEALL